MNAREEILRFLRSCGINYELLEHPAVFHMEDCLQISEPAGAVYCKNYFLTTKSKKTYAVLVTRPEVRLRTSDISHQAGTPRLSFADARAMEELLHTKPGAVTPLGLLFDTDNKVLLLMDRSLRASERLAFHPCDNTATVLLHTDAFFNVFLPAIGHDPRFVEIHDEGDP